MTTLVKVYPMLETEADAEIEANHIADDRLSSCVKKQISAAVERVPYAKRFLYVTLEEHEDHEVRRSTMLGATLFYDHAFATASMVSGSTAVSKLLTVLYSLRRGLLTEQHGCQFKHEEPFWLSAGGSCAGRLLRYVAFPDRSVKAFAKELYIDEPQPHQQQDAPVHVYHKDVPTDVGLPGTVLRLIVMVPKVTDPGQCGRYQRCGLPGSKLRRLQEEKLQREAERARIQMLYTMTLVVPSWPASGIRQTLWAAIDTHHNSQLPLHGFVRSAVIVEYDIDQEELRLEFTPPLYSSFMNGNPTDLCLRLRLTPDGEDLMSNVRLNKVHLYAGQDIEYDTRINYEGSAMFTFRVLTSIAIPARYAELDPKRYPKESTQLWGTMMFLWVRQQHATRVIQRAWRRVVSSPEYAVCRRRLLREYYNMVSAESLVCE
jgi:hypothetical protein